MVEYTLSLDSVFGSLADPTRRDILKRVSSSELSVSEIAQPYDLSLAAVSKHLKVLEKARLIIKRRRGKQHLVRLSPGALANATDYLEWYQEFMVE
jgi:DNA-binding transcriptional ArsR family regulator